MEEEQRSAFVQHGFRSWVDYSKTGIMRRQFLISDYSADILTNFVAVALTLTAPRLWILVRAFFIWLNNRYISWTRSKDTTNLSNHQPNFAEIPLNEIVEHNLDLVSHSHSELSAAKNVLRSLLAELRAGKIALPVANPEVYQQNPRASRTVRTWRSTVKRCGDVLFPIVFSVFLLCSFVAQSTGAVLSARIFGDSFALSTSPECTHLFLSSSNRETNYQRTCYASSIRASDCNLYANRTISYTEKADGDCPFRDGHCIPPTVTFDTGQIDAKTLGLNIKQQFLVRLQTTCTYIKLDEDLYEEAEVSKDLSFSEWDNFQAPVPRRLQSCRLTNGRHVGPQIRQLDIRCPLSIFKTNFRSNITLREVPVWVGITRDQYIMPNEFRGFSSKYKLLKSTTRSQLLRYMACIKYGEVCDPNGSCSLPSRPSFHPGEISTDIFRKSNDIFSHFDPHSDEDMAQVLLDTVLMGALERNYQIRGGDCSPPATSGDDECYLSVDQWKDLTRRRWEESLAFVQERMVDIVRGVTRDEYPPGLPIPNEYRRLCKLVKFRSTGWRNVSTWGLTGLLSLSLFITLGSTKTEDNRLWLMIGLQKITGWLKLAVTFCEEIAGRVLGFISIRGFRVLLSLVRR